MVLHPPTDSRQAVHRPLVELPPSCRPDVEQQVTPLAHHLDQHPHQLVNALPGRLVAVVPPRTREGLAGLPHYRLSVHLHPHARHELLGRAYIPPSLHIEQVQPVVDDDPRLQFARHLQQFLAPPVVAPLALPAVGPSVRSRRIAEVVEQHVDLAEPGQQLAHLPVQVVDVLLLVPSLVQLLALRMVAHRMDIIDDEIRVVPVDERVVEPHLHILGAKSLHHRPQQIATGRRAGRLVVGQL